MALQWMFLLLLTPLLAAQNHDKPSSNTYGKSLEKGKCKAPSDWDSRLWFIPKRSSYDLDEVVQLNCTGKFLPSVPQIQCISRGAQATWNETATCKERCQQPQWDSQLQFSPNQRFYRVSEEVTLSCFLNDAPPLAVIRCANRPPPKQNNAWEVLAIGGTWHRLTRKLTCTMAKCPKPQWDAQVQFSESKTEYPQNAELTLTCPKGLEPSFPKVKCTKEFQRLSSGKPDYADAWWGRNSRGAWTRIERDVLCTEGCQRPPWDSRLQLVPDQENYEKDEEVNLNCPGGLQPTFTEIKCQTGLQDYYDDVTQYSLHKEAWHGRDSRGAWVPIQSSVECIEGCQRPPWDSRLRLVPDQENYEKEEKVKLSCPGGLQPTFTEIKCQSGLQDYDVLTQYSGFEVVWHGRDSTGAWVPIQSSVECIEGCQRPSWDSRLQLAPDQENYGKNEKVKLSCPRGFQPTFTEIKCQTGLQDYYDDVTQYSVQKEFWHERDSTGAWVPIQSSVECIEILQVDSNTSEISSSSIKLKWTCRFPDACQGLRAMCRLAAPSSPPCEAEEVKGEQMLHGQEGTFTCSPLQPFTEYRVTIDLPPNTTLFSWLYRTKQTVPDKPQQLWLDPDRGSLRWNSLPSCNGEIIGYQLSITARNAADSSVLETERLRLNGSVTELRLPEHSPGSSYAVTIQGLTAAGAGAALAKEFRSSSSSSSNSSDTPRPQGISCRSARDIAPWQGTAVLALSPIARGSGAAREHQLLVAPTHNGSVIEGMCSGQPQLLNGSVYVAAVLNLSAPTAFVLGDGSRGQGEHNAALRPGCGYTALLRLARRSPQAEKFTCVCYSFSLVAGQTAGQWHGIVIGLVVLLAVLLVAAVILWCVLSRKRKYLPNKTQEDNEKGKSG